MSFKIYTKSGDKGETSLIGGKRVPKYNDQIEAYGTLDELNSYLGLIRDLCTDESDKITLLQIQEKIFIAESLLAVSNIEIAKTLPQIVEDDIKILEQEIDLINEKIPKLKSFIIPGGHYVSSHCHVARCICRRCERLTIKLVHNNEHIDKSKEIIQYLNRLSDYLFILARKFIYDFGEKETNWLPKKQ